MMATRNQGSPEKLVFRVTAAIVIVTSRPEKFPFYWELTKTPFREREMTTDEVVDFFKNFRRGVVQVVGLVDTSACICRMHKTEVKRES